MKWTFSLEAKLWGIYHGLKTILGHEMYDVETEMDSKIVIKMFLCYYKSHCSIVTLPGKKLCSRCLGKNGHRIEFRLHLSYHGFYTKLNLC